MTRKLALAAHRLAIRLAPRHVRDRHREEMTATFAEVVDTAASLGHWAVLRALVRELWDVLVVSHRDRAPHQIPTQASETSMTNLIRQFIGPRELAAAARSLTRRPMFTLAAVATLAFGTAATTTLFGIVDTVLLRPLPYPDADRLVMLQETNSSKRGQISLIAPGRLEDWNRLNHTFTSMAGLYTENVTETSGDTPERLAAYRVTPRYFTVYGVAPIAGRIFTPEEERFGGPAAAVISEAFWARRFNRSPSAVGSRLRLGATSFTVVGVMPGTFTAALVDLWAPAQTPPQIQSARDARFLGGTARMRPGVTIDQAMADLAEVQRELGREFPTTDKDWSVSIRDLKTARVSNQSQTLWVAFGAVGLLWLIGVANLAGLMLVQMHRRSREIAIRTAIGASRGHIVIAVLREGAILAAAGAGLGAAAAAWLTGLVRTTFTTLPRLNELGIDWRALVFCAAASGVAALVCGLWPALHMTRGRARVSATMAMASRGSSAARHRLQRGLVSAQVALSVLLVASAALLVRSYVNLTQASPGFQPDGVVTFHLGARWDEDRDRIGEMQVKFIDALERLPGVEAAGFANFLPTMNATLRYQVTVQGLTGPELNGAMSVGTRMIGGHYLQALQASMAGGAACPPLRHDFKMKPSAVVNRRFVDEFAGGENIVGRDLTFAQNPQVHHVIVGTVADIGEDPPGSGSMPYVYTCDPSGSWPDPEYVVRAGSTQALATSIRQIAKTIDPNRAIFGFRPLTEVAASALDQPRLTAGVMGAFAAAALTLAALGLYSLFMLLVGESTREIGVRLALGAAPAQMTRLVLAGAGRLLAIGVAIGLALSTVTSRLLGSLLFGVKPIDVMTFGAAAIILAAVSAVAVAIPALRAGRVDPLVVMKTD